MEGNPKDVKPGLRREPVTHWNLILPQIICYIVVLKVLKLKRMSSADVLWIDQALSLRTRAQKSAKYFLNDPRGGHVSAGKLGKELT